MSRRKSAGTIGDLVVLGDWLKSLEVLTKAGESVFTRNIRYLDSGDPAVTQTPAWSEGVDIDAIGQSYLYSKTTGDKLTFTFIGTAIWVRFKLAPNAGKATVTIDSGTPMTVDLYDPVTVYREACIKRGLERTSHTIEIKVSGTKNASSSDYYINVDAFTYEVDVGAMQVLALIEGLVSITGAITAFLGRTDYAHVYESD